MKLNNEKITKIIFIFGVILLLFFSYLYLYYYLKYLNFKCTKNPFIFGAKQLSKEGYKNIVGQIIVPSKNAFIYFNSSSLKWYNIP